MTLIKTSSQIKEFQNVEMCCWLQNFVQLDMVWIWPGNGGMLKWVQCNSLKLSLKGNKLISVKAYISLFYSFRCILTRPQCFQIPTEGEEINDGCINYFLTFGF